MTATTNADFVGPQSLSSVAVTPPKESVAQLQFCRWNLLACINCAQSKNFSTTSSETIRQQQQLQPTVSLSSAETFDVSNINAPTLYSKTDPQFQKLVSHPSDVSQDRNVNTITTTSNEIEASNGIEGVLTPNRLSHGGNDNEGGIINKLRKPAGPILLELKRMRFQQANFEEPQFDFNGYYPAAKGMSLFDVTTVCQSRGNPSLGTSVSSTCLDVWKPGDRFLDNGNALPLCATGLSTGALCVHSFATNPDSMGDEIAWSSKIDYFYTPRNQRTATAVAWKPLSGYSNHQIAIGLTGGTSSGVPVIQSAAPSDNLVLNLHRHASANNITNNSLVKNRGSSALLSTSIAGGVNANAGNMGPSVASGRPTSGVREYCCFVWDVEHQPQQQGPTLVQSDSRRTKTATPLYTLSHQTGVASLAWLLEGGQILAVGGQQRNMQLYDLRVDSSSGGTPPVFTIYAHNHGVHGIEANPARPWQFVSWSRAPGEVVKLWDARRMDSPAICDIKVSGNNISTIVGGPTKTHTKTGSEHDGRKSSGTPIVSSSELTGIQTVTSVKWSGETEGSLAVVLGGTTMHTYETSTTSSARLGPNSTIQAKQPILDMAHYPFLNSNGILDPKADDDESASQMKVTAQLFQKRMAVIYNDRSVNDVAKHRIAPVCISRRDGRVVHSLGRTLWTCNGVSRSTYNDEDISSTMMRRAGCLNELKYSMDSNMNVALLVADDIKCKPTTKHDSHASSIRNELIRLWKWIQRVERLCYDNEVKDESGGNNFWSSKSLLDSGAWRLLSMDDGTKSEMQYHSESLCCTTYESDGRIAVLTSCGWARTPDLGIALVECEDHRTCERRAALAVWSGEIGAAVETLQRGADSIRNQKKILNGAASPEHRVSSEYAQILELSSLSIAGYRGGDVKSSAYQIWRKSSLTVLERPELSEREHKPGPEAYVRHILKFLISIGIDDSYQSVLADNTLSLTDRVAFACRFLSPANLKNFLHRCIADSLRTGNVEAITLTGIGKNGIKILQSYVDRTSDVQTAALVTSRVVLPTDWTNERRLTAEWLQSYRSLLNTWQMWQSRAIFDVDRAQLLRMFKQRQADLIMNKAGASNVPGGRRAMSSRRIVRIVDPEVQAAVPAQLDARCNYCSAQLGLRKQQDNKPEHWLSNMKNVISCCPNCRKPLPRCAICMLQLGALNPYTELRKEQSRAVRTTPNDDLSSLASLPFAEWFTWCVRCKHGGHAHHMVGWFAKHNVCPVSGCSCNCQFDAIQKLIQRTPTPSHSTMSSEKLLQVD